MSRRLAHVAYELHANLERALGDALVELDLTLPLADALWQLDPALGPLSRRQLSERLGCHPSNVTFLINRLERRRLVTRAGADADRRVRMLALTPAGARAREHLIATLAASSLFSRLTSSERRQLVVLLGRCGQN
ncbi:MAG TPA: MarR family transcriptional regulator [Solirubrobacteraceae bacterium]|nr:MarR family transcriptional regulator [Solirubrobacteraceae bacterium]